MMPNLAIRKADLRDAEAVAAFNAALAFETEGKVLLPERIDPGVRRLLGDPSLGFYVVAERPGEVVGSLMVTNEWSDWRNGLFWWIQSVYIVPAARRQGVYRALYDFVRDMARADPGICGFRLYVEKDNTAAQRTYGSLGMTPTDYLVYEELKGGEQYFGKPVQGPPGRS